MRVHISLPVTNLARSRAFYSSLFGVPATKVKADYLNYRLDEPAIHLSLIPHDKVTPCPHQHFGIELPDSETFTAWELRGANTAEAQSIRPEPDAQCCYARGSKLWLTDPDGHRWELWHRTGEFDGMQASKQDRPSACC